MLTDDQVHDECGVFGIHAPGEDVANDIEPIAILR